MKLTTFLILAIINLIILNVFKQNTQRQKQRLLPRLIGALATLA